MIDNRFNHKTTEKMYFLLAKNKTFEFEKKEQIHFV